jgi:hypothetical protein
VDTVFTTASGAGGGDDEKGGRLPVARHVSTRPPSGWA